MPNTKDILEARLSESEGITFLLGKMSAQMDALQKSFAEHKDYMQREIRDIKARVTDLERKDDKESGMWSGAKLVIDIAKMTPPALLAFFIGKET